MARQDNSIEDDNIPLGPQAHYFAALEKGDFIIQRCTACEKSVFPPRILCPHCGDAALTFFPASGEGTVYSTTTIRRPAEKGGDYNVCLVDLDEGVRLMSQIDTSLPENVQIGMRVRAKIIPADREVTGQNVLLVFDLI